MLEVKNVRCGYDNNEIIKNNFDEYSTKEVTKSEQLNKYIDNIIGLINQNKHINDNKFNKIINQNENNNTRTLQQIDDLKEKVENYNIKINDYSSENSKLKENVNTLNESIKCKEAELEEFKELNAKQSLEEKVSLENKISSLEKDLKDALNKKDLFKSRNREINFQLQNFKYKVLDLEKKLIDSQFKLAVEKREKNPLLR